MALAPSSLSHNNYEEDFCLNQNILNNFKVEKKHEKKANTSERMKQVIINHVLLNNERIINIADVFGINKRTIQKWCRKKKIGK